MSSLKKNMKGKMKAFRVRSIEDDTGSLIALESETQFIPFDIERVYYIFDTTPGTARGHHAHKKLKQVLISISGSCTVVCDNGKQKKEYILDWPDKALYIEGMVWREMKNFSKGAVLLVLASEKYNEDDYIRNHATFLKQLKDES